MKENLGDYTLVREDRENSIHCVSAVPKGAGRVATSRRDNWPNWQETYPKLSFHTGVEDYHLDRREV